ncbi:LD-carboxypeptidase [Staphylococcus sp. ACRSN]|uniref:S66 family peptidase n=1 Tax=Staphylococcus sp. ACRSN TaxID=2918214 RepID=UPI001EF1DC69|nr:S66 peptidase family protein [Staphylococcus sp. ACRSN]MCG7339582.1 LD-carboxypeptidase [Staphylococcus sp. ACRSN]
MKKPSRLHKGDTVAIVSLSSGIAGDNAYLWRTMQGLKNLKRQFDLKIKIMPNALKGSTYLANHPQARANDLNEALKDMEVKAILNCIGGNDAHVILPYIDEHLLKSNPKLFMGYSDTTSIHLLFYKMGIVSYYGPTLLTDFAENGSMDQYTIEHIEHCWFKNTERLTISPSKYIRTEGEDWMNGNNLVQRGKQINGGHELLNGNQTVTGKLFGGNLETLIKHIQSDLFPKPKELEGAILFIETSELDLSVEDFTYYLNLLLTDEMLENLNGIIVGKPYLNIKYEQYKQVIIDKFKSTSNCTIPILYNLSFGHNEPKAIIPYGLKAEINCKLQNFSIIEKFTSYD